ncbi:hypothetical protein [Marinitenerispora sediminis]|uniref:Uncharacterized protein n=1 Tax=Marinitenerispora sediminis TaxID=1931232 RepID=A0A368T263_9ACTN|nr:hypothetical protein [Marinitenerispora sediminis]RCV50530.1 hypothetical protein DEF28_17840 [Marinitenerispora sediminis]RCV55384.1 hypothetical protein DEF24_18005 [Marinitenerispora sediminis]RCV59377.1 hypothetical protein DEF23_07405 [Marinitenerispora sediminis]
MTTDPNRAETDPRDLEPEESSVEAPEADTAEQRAALLDREEPQAPDIGSAVELPEADAVEQSVDVETDGGEEEYR